MTSDWVNDYRFGWRWILPASPRRVLSEDSQVEAYWRSCIPHADESVDLSVIDADACLRQRDAASELIGAEHICLYGSGKSIRRASLLIGTHGASVRDYALIPPGRPRIVVPLSSRRALIRGLELHRPGRVQSRITMLGVRWLAMLGCKLPLRRCMIRIIARRVHRPWPLSSTGINEFDDADFAQYLGVEGALRKTVVLPITKRTQPGVIIKSAESPAARDKVAQEARMLGYLATTNLADQVPKLRFFRSNESNSVLVQQYLPVTGGSSAKRDSAAIDFLAASLQVGSSTMSLSRYVHERVPELLDPPVSKLIADLLAKHGDIPLPLGLTHGDFAPWNCGICSGRLVAYDWEEGREDGIPLSDAFSYTVLPLLLVKKIRDPGRIASQTLEFATRTYAAKNIDSSVMKLSFALWCLSRSESLFSEIYIAMAEWVVDGL